MDQTASFEAPPPDDQTRAAPAPPPGNVNPAAPLESPTQAVPAPALSGQTRAAPAPPPADQTRSPAGPSAGDATRPVTASPPPAAPANASTPEDATRPVAGLPIAGQTRAGPTEEDATRPVSLPAAAEPPPLEAGTTLGHYRIVEPMRRGRLTAVYKAFDPSLARNVTIRVLPAALVSAPGFRERFSAEARAIDRFRHPNILTMLDYGEERGILYVVTEFVESTALAEHLGGPLPLDQVAAWLTPIASALDYAHALGVVHRDVNPATILLTREAPPTPVLTDFSLVDASAQALQLANWSSAVGTPEYMAPEQAAGEAVGPATDQYAVAVVAYQLLTGRLPFLGPPQVVLRAQVQDPPPPPRTVNQEVGAAVEEALLKGLAKHPEERFRTVGDLVVALTAPETKSRSAVPPTPVAPKSVLRPGVLAAALALLLALALLSPPARGGEARLKSALTGRGQPGGGGGGALTQTTAVPSPTGTAGAAATTAPVVVAAPATATATPLPPTATAIPPTATAIPPTATPKPLPTATATAAPVAAAPTPGCILEADRQDDPQACRLTEKSTATYALGYVGAEYFARTTELGSIIGSLVGSIATDSYADVVLSVDARLVGETADRVIALGCRISQAQNGAVTGYVFQVNPDSGETWLRKEANGGQSTLQGLRPSPAIKHGQLSNHLELRCSGNTISATVNGVSVVSVSDPTALASGAVDIGVSRLAAGNGSAEARFANLKVGLP